MAAAVDGVLLVDKPPGITSTKALSLARRALEAPKAGHTGTLDPFATGLLPLVFGEATKFSRFLLDSDKSYRATLHLGATSTTGDTEGTILAGEFASIELSAVSRTLATFRGVSRQVPPMHSAVRIEGQRLYDLARQGLEVDRPSREVRINSLEIVEVVGQKLVIDVNCSKGTYIRTLAEDIGKSLGCGAYLTGLRRTAIGRFVVQDAATPECLANLGTAEARERLLPTHVLVESLPRIDLEEAGARAIRNGQVLPVAADCLEGEHALFGPAGELIGVGEVAQGRLAAARLLNTGHGG